MKKFNFSMQKVLEYNGHIQNQEKNILKEMQINYHKLCKEMDELLQKYEAIKVDYQNKCEAGIVINEIIIIKSYTKGIQTKINEQSKQIETVKIEIEQQIQKIVDITRDKTSMEKLREKHLEIYKTIERKEEEIFINEFIVNSVSSQSNNNDSIG
jgi:flagellar FliJ protein